MNQYRRGLVGMLFVVGGLVIGGTLLHNWGQTVLEEDPVSLLISLEFVTQTMTTVGYGQEAGWSHPLMYVFVIALQLAGITVVFMSIPVVVTPWLESRLQTTAPTGYEGPDDHILITRFSDSLEDLLEELERRDLPYLVLESDEETATELFQRDHKVMRGEAREPEVLLKAKAHKASTIILEGEDQRNAAVSLVLKEIERKHSDNPLDIVAVAKNANRAVHLEQAGAREVIYPREVIGEALAEKVVSGSGASLDFGTETGFEVREFVLMHNHELVNRSLGSARLRDRYGVNVIGLWRMGTFIKLRSGLRLQANDVLVVAGTPERLETLSEDIEVGTRWSDDGGRQNVMIIGYGHEGMAARRILNQHGIEPTVVNDVEMDAVDVVGDGMNEEVLQLAGIEQMDTVVITISLDDASVMVALMVNRLNPEAEILVQVNTSPTVESAYRAGASYVQSLDQVTSRMLVSQVLGETFLDFDLSIEFTRATAGALANQTLSEANLPDEYGVIAVGVKRNGELLSCVEPDFKFLPEDVLYLVGEDSDLEQLCYDLELEPLPAEK